MSLHSESSLFRQEVYGAQSQQWMGAIRLAQPISAWLIALVAAGVTLALVSYITLGSITKKARVTGMTLPAGGSISVLAPASGILKQVFVAEGQTVHAGQALCELSTEHQGEHGEITALVAQQLAARQHSLKAERQQRTQQTSEKKAAIRLRLSNLQTESAQLQQEIHLAERRQTLAQDSLNKFQNLQGSGGNHPEN